MFSQGARLRTRARTRANSPAVSHGVAREALTPGGFLCQLNRGYVKWRFAHHMNVLDRGQSGEGHGILSRLRATVRTEETVMETVGQWVK